jgi:hypothetical protein
VPAQDGEPVSTRVSWATLGVDAARRDVLMQLARGRLVSVDADAVAIAHEALARAWPRLRGWLSEDGGFGEPPHGGRARRRRGGGVG